MRTLSAGRATRDTFQQTLEIYAASGRRVRFRHERPRTMSELTVHPARWSAPVMAREMASALRLCHFTIAHTDHKSRSFHRACLPLARSGIEVRYLAPVVVRGRRDNVDFIPLPKRRGRLSRFLASPLLLRELVRQDAHLYHFQDPELLPLGFALKMIFRKRVVYDAYEDFPSMMAEKRAIPRFLRPLVAKIIAAAENLAARGSRLWRRLPRPDVLSVARDRRWRADFSPMRGGHAVARRDSGRNSPAQEPGLALFRRSPPLL